MTRKSSVSPQPSGDRTWYTLASVAKLQGCSQRTVREWCKQGHIPEAIRGPGGHWKIEKPLSDDTRSFLGRKRGDWWFIGGDEGEFEADFVEELLIASLCRMETAKFRAIPFNREIEEGGRKAKDAEKIRTEVYNRVAAGKSLDDLILIGRVNQFCRKEARCPTLIEISAAMGLSRTAFSRRFSLRDLRKAYQVASGISSLELPDPDGLDPVEKANRNARRQR